MVRGINNYYLNITTVLIENVSSSKMVSSELKMFLILVVHNSDEKMSFHILSDCILLHEIPFKTILVQFTVNKLFNS